MSMVPCTKGVSPTNSLDGVSPALIPGTFQQKVKDVIGEGGVFGDPQMIGKNEEHLTPLDRRNQAALEITRQSFVHKSATAQNGAISRAGLSDFNSALSLYLRRPIGFLGISRNQKISERIRWLGRHIHGGGKLPGTPEDFGQVVQRDFGSLFRSFNIRQKHFKKFILRRIGQAPLLVFP